MTLNEENLSMFYSHNRLLSYFSSCRILVGRQFRAIGLFLASLSARCQVPQKESVDCSDPHLRNKISYRSSGLAQLDFGTDCFYTSIFKHLSMATGCCWSASVVSGNVRLLMSRVQTGFHYVRYMVSEPCRRRRSCDQPLLVSLSLQRHLPLIEGSARGLSI